ncbi:MAG: hypothetical protein IPN09_03670 [Bacteroidetes bacterium]|nr:hypothetical protein [Bacteroidota bacterium]
MKYLVTTKILLDEKKNEINRFMSEISIIQDNELLLNKFEFDEFGKEINSLSFEYNKDRILIKFVEIELNDDLPVKKLSLFSDLGLSIKEIISYLDGTEEIYNYYLTDDNLYEKLFITNENNEIIRSEFNYYDEKRNLIREINFEFENEVSRIEHFYKEDKIIQENHYLDSKLDKIVFIDYNEKEIISEVIVKDSKNKKILHKTFEYDEFENLIFYKTMDFIENYETIEEKGFNIENQIVGTIAKKWGFILEMI